MEKIYPKIDQKCAPGQQAMAEVFHRYHAAATNLAFAPFYPNKLGYEFSEVARRNQPENRADFFYQYARAREGC